MLAVVPEWEPVLLARLPRGEDARRLALRGRARQRDGGRRPPRRASRPAARSLARPAGRRTPSSAMLAATYAKGIGRAVAFSLAAFRQAFAAGRDLSDPDNVAIAAAACEMHPAALLKGVELRRTREALERATEARRAAGVRTVPTIARRRPALRRRGDDRGRRRRRSPRREGRTAPTGCSCAAAGWRPRSSPSAGASTTSRWSRSRPARWRCTGTSSPRRAARLARPLRADLVQLDALTFIVKWEDATESCPTSRAPRPSSASSIAASATRLGAGRRTGYRGRRWPTTSPRPRREREGRPLPDGDTAREWLGHRCS